jgi:hypothetical protein
MHVRVERRHSHYDAKTAHITTRLIREPGFPHKPLSGAPLNCDKPPGGALARQQSASSTDGVKRGIVR